ncbi:hypothetical protein B0H10DRAFT_1749987, partial [Mycena sp. CBHHK59/15]
PAVSLERSHFISSVTCNSVSNSMDVTFKDSVSFHTAVKDWSSHRSGFLLISYVAGCGLGTDSAERSFHLISHIVISNAHLHIICRTVPMSIHNTLDQNHNIKLHVATYKLD